MANGAGKVRIVLRQDLRRAPEKAAVQVRREAPKKPIIVPEGKDRLNLQIDDELKRWAQDYAKRNHTSLTQLITDYFVELRKREDGEGVEQI